MMDDQLFMSFPDEQFRAVRLQVLNWGTFQGAVDVPISEKGFLFVGASGSGKSTLLDAFSQLLIPPRWIDFNAAAHESGMRMKGDRNLVSYVRGAWAEQQRETGVATQYLRTGTQLSGLALTFKNKSRRTVTLMQILWIRGATNAVGDLRRLYLILERDADLKTELERFRADNMDVRRIRSLIPDARIYDQFAAYGTEFCRQLGIRSERALKLLHKTQSAKNLGDLNEFLRSFMLDAPKTYDVAARLVDEFTELEASHRAVVEARKQIAILRPAHDRFDEMEHQNARYIRLGELSGAVDAFGAAFRRDLFAADELRLSSEVRHWESEIVRLSGLEGVQKNAINDLHIRKTRMGGQMLAGWEREKIGREQDRDRTLRARGRAEEACRQLGWQPAQSAEGYAELLAAARTEANDYSALHEERRAAVQNLSGQRHDTQTKLHALREEIELLESQKSGIPAKLLKLRHKISEETGIPESELPFVGECIEMMPDEGAWRGAVERALRPFALSMLADSSCFDKLSQYADANHLGEHLRFCRTGGAHVANEEKLAEYSILRRIRVTDSKWADWIEANLRRNYDFVCAENGNMFMTAHQAVTKSGLVRRSAQHFEKDDRHPVNDPRSWVLGTDNSAKLEALRAEEDTLDRRRIDLDAAIRREEAADDEATRRLTQCRVLTELAWSDIDPAPILADIRRLEEQIRAVRDKSDELDKLEADIRKLEAELKQTTDLLTDARVKKGTADRDLDALRKQSEALEAEYGAAVDALTDDLRRDLTGYFAFPAGKIGHEAVITATRAADRRISADKEAAKSAGDSARNDVEDRFKEFRRQFESVASDLGDTVDYAGGYFKLLDTLEKDRLPDFESKFRDLLRQQSMQNLSQLSQYLTEERRDILQRMEYVNESLKLVPFNVSTSGRRTYLSIVPRDRNLPDVTTFRSRIASALTNAWDTSSNEDEAERRFAILSDLVDHLRDTPENRRWRDTVLDVRGHVEFIGQECDEDGREVEVYRSGAGKSGGQRQKLTTTCLAAALRYQLCGDSESVPTYAPIILDEAFDKADSEFTALSMNIFRNFGFQMIVATPDKSVTTLEPFIGGACVVHIADRRYSSVLSIPYDDASQQLRWHSDEVKPAEKAEAAQTEASA